jgi:hypothetical protein
MGIMTFEEACELIDCKNCGHHFSEHVLRDASCLFNPGTAYEGKHPNATWASLHKLIASGRGSSARAIVDLLTGDDQRIL